MHARLPSRSADRLADLAYPYRRATAALAWVGATLAGVTAPIALVRINAVSAVLFAVVATVLVAGGVACWRGSRIALAIAGLLLAGQVVGLAGSAIELVLNPDDAKATALQSLGVSHRVGSAVNVLYSATAFALFMVMWSRRRRR